MSNVINLFAALPDRDDDKRISRLHRRFERDPFSVFDAADCLHITSNAAWSLLFHDPGLVDGRFRVINDGSRFRLVPIPAETAAILHFKAKYIPLIKSLGGDEFSADTFSKATGCPYASANFILSLLHKDGALEASVPNGLDPGGVAYRLVKKRKVIRRIEDSVTYSGA